jgi:hypothetical protein
MKCKILKKYRDERGNEAYEIQCPGWSESKEYKKNIGRQCLVGKEFIDEKDPDMYRYSDEGTNDSIELEPVELILDNESNGYYQIDHKNKKGDDDRDWIHRIICYSWRLEYNLDKDEVDHVDRNKLNNHLSNLKPVPAFANSAKEFKHNNPSAREHMSKSIMNTFKLANYSDLIRAMKFLLEQEEYLVINELSKDIDQNGLKRLIYILEKQGYTVKKDDGDDDSSSVKV